MSSLGSHRLKSFPQCSLFVVPSIAYSRIEKGCRQMSMTFWLARSTILFSSFEYAVDKEWSVPDNRVSSWMSEFWKAVPRSVWMAAGVPKRLKCWNKQLAVSYADTLAVGNNSTHLQKASMTTNMNWYPLPSPLSWPIWFKWSTSKGLYDALKRMCLDGNAKSIHHLITWALTNELNDHSIGDIQFLLKRFLHIYKPWCSLWTAAIVL